MSDLSDAATGRSSIRRAVDGEQLEMENPIDYLVGLLLEGKRYDGAWDGDEEAVAKYAIASWCQELGWAPNLRDYDAGEQVDLGDEVPSLEAAFYEYTVDDVQERGESDLPTMVYETEHGERRRVRYERVQGQPWQVERRVDRHDGRTWVPCGADPLGELIIDGEHRAAVTVIEGP